MKNSQSRSNNQPVSSPQIHIPKLPLSDLCSSTNHHQSSKMSKTSLSNSTFYWIPLTQMDRKFLSTAEAALSGTDLKKIKSYCTFLQTIVKIVLLFFQLFNPIPYKFFRHFRPVLKSLRNLRKKIRKKFFRCYPNDPKKPFLGFSAVFGTWCYLKLSFFEKLKELYHLCFSHTKGV